MPYNFCRIHPMATVAMQELGRFVFELRAERGMSQRRLAAASGVSQSMISRVENGKAPGTSVETLARVLAGLDRAVEDDPLGWAVDAPPWSRIMIERFSTRGRLAKRIAERKADALRQRDVLLRRLIAANARSRRRAEAATRSAVSGRRTARVVSLESPSSASPDRAG